MNHQRVYPDIVGLLSPCMCSAFGYATVAIIVCRMDHVHYTHLEGINLGSFLGQTLEKAPNVTRIRLQIVRVCACQLRSATSRDRPTLLFNGTTEDATSTELAHVSRSIIISPEQTVVIRRISLSAVGASTMNHQRVYPILVCKWFGNKYRRVGISFYLMYVQYNVLEYAANTAAMINKVERLFEKL